MICKGMVDELRYNDAGNEVTLIKRFALDQGGPPSGEWGVESGE